MICPRHAAEYEHAQHLRDLRNEAIKSARTRRRICSWYAFEGAYGRRRALMRTVIGGWFPVMLNDWWLLYHHRSFDLVFVATRAGSEPDRFVNSYIPKTAVLGFRHCRELSPQISHRSSIPSCGVVQSRSKKTGPQIPPLAHFRHQHAYTNVAQLKNVYVTVRSLPSHSRPIPHAWLEDCIWTILCLPTKRVQFRGAEYQLDMKGLLRALQYCAALN
ncbi:uncharacterized protein ARMOST_02724 [Armillaria ostoyae]|uniref:Uncharacterized protein n=1 Tax=Armillaria ostoyae TaxID=47428 RepID=A0A284QSN8_ARMOS|nr:uncharacterized protein ARMOST_02724 [Armillaria ostoyae]